MLFFSLDLNFSLLADVGGFPGGLDSRVHLQCRKPGFDPWVVE